METSPTFEAGKPRLRFAPRQDVLEVTATAGLQRFLAATSIQGAAPYGITVLID